MLSRSFYSFETSELHTAYDEGLRRRANSMQQYQDNKKEKREGEGAGVQLTSKKSKPSKHSLSRDRNGKMFFYEFYSKNGKTIYITLANIHMCA